MSHAHTFCPNIPSFQTIISITYILTCLLFIIKKYTTILPHFHYGYTAYQAKEAAILDAPYIIINNTFSKAVAVNARQGGVVKFYIIVIQNAKLQYTQQNSS